MAEYVKISLLKDFVLGLGVDWGTAGSTSYWKVLEEMPRGSLLIQHDNQRAILEPEDLKTGERHMEPNLSYPLGLHFGIERGYKRRWYGKYTKGSDLVATDKDVQ